MVAKLAAHVGAPVLLLLALGAQVRGLFRTQAEKEGLWPPLIVLGAIILALLSFVSPALNRSPASTLDHDLGLGSAGGLRLDGPGSRPL